jgi:ubiquinone/menaquinone biosynthesis C-methylase UbiE
MTDKKRRICPVARAGSLDNRIRRWLQNPQKILGPYVKKRMTVLDLGCGPGLFSIELAEMVGESGRIIAADLQEGMLQKLRDKIQGTELEERITLHKCEGDRVGVSEQVDFVLAFYMIHEVPDQIQIFKEIESILKPTGQFLIVEPKLFHVSKKAFENMVMNAKVCGFEAVEEPKVFLSRSVILRRG